MIEDNDFGVVQETVAQIRPLLAGKGAHIQGAIVADLLAIFLAAHAPHLREQTKEMLLTTVDALVPVNEQLMFPSGKHPYVELYGDEEAP